MRAMAPAVLAGKSVASQPLVELGAGVGGKTRSVVATTAAVTSPAAEYCVIVWSTPFV
jgi:hypothetical protein